MKKYLSRCACLFLLVTTFSHAAELESIHGATLVDVPWNDGDSFLVNAGGRKLHIRLYYVDCPETRSERKVMLERIREQQHHFGLADPREVVEYGKRATERVREWLAKPFTVHTSYARAPGAAVSSRYYAFIETHNGDDLAHLLVSAGLARIYGNPRISPAGKSRDIIEQELRDLRTAAVRKRNGIWRSVQSEISEILDRLNNPCKHPPINLNTATAKELQQLYRIGKKYAAEIIANRPHQSVQDLRKISGIGVKTVKKIAPCATVKPRQ